MSALSRHVAEQFRHGFALLSDLCRLDPEEHGELVRAVAAQIAAVARASDRPSLHDLVCEALAEARA